jgi:predicted acyl esterase
MKGVPLVLFLVLAIAALAGCVQSDSSKTGSNSVPAGAASFPAGTFQVDKLSPKQFTAKAAEETWVTASDGKRMNAAVYRPDTTEKVPVYINFSPYWADTAMTKGDAFATYMIDEYVPRGFAVVLAAVRGTGHSEGCFEVGSDRELMDLNEVVDFFSKQSWSNGNIAAGAKSYDATSQNGMVAKFPHPALKGIFHVEGITDMYSYTYQEGVPARQDAAAFNAEYSATQGLSEYGPTGAVAGDPTDESPESLARLADDAACTQTPMHVANPGASMVAGVKTAYWQERDWTTSIAHSKWEGSIFFVHGLQDWNVQPSHILPWLTEVQKNKGIHVYAWIHQWTRDDQVGGDGHVYPKRTDWNVTMLAWLDTILKGKDVGFKLDDYQVQGDDMQWRESAVWPPRGQVLTVTAARGLTPDLSGVATLPVGTFPPGVADRITGEVIANVTATSTNPDPVIEVSLVDVDGDGHASVFGEGVLRGVLRDSLESPTPVPLGQATAYSVRLFPLDHIVLPGHHVEVRFGHMPSPNVDVGNPQNSGVTSGVQHAFVLPSQELGITYTGPAEVRMPIAPADTLPVQPALMNCFTC